MIPPGVRDALPLAPVLLFGLFLVSACRPPEPSLASADVVGVLSRPVDDRFARALGPVDFSFPLDHGPHEEYATEWWYYTGNLTGEDGGEYGYQLTFFRSGLAPGESDRPSDFAAQQLYMAHFAVTSGPARQHLSFDRFSRGAAGVAGASSSPEYSVWLDNWRAQQTGPGRMHLVAAAEGEDGPVSIDLTLTETRSPLLHGENGYSRKGPEVGNANHYYSLARMDTTGQIVFAGSQVPVSGFSWMDHEFGTSALSEDAVGWDWFAVTLDNGVVLMFAEIRTRSGPAQDIFDGTLSFPDGRQLPIASSELELTPTGSWTSPDTGILYPSGWRAVFPQHQIELTIEPLIDDQEMDVAFIYYEGATIVSGLMEGRPVSGRGYVELTGYGAAGFRR